MMPHLRFGLILGTLWATSPVIGAEPVAEISFNRDIRPILSNRCFKCHGPDLKKASLELQSRDIALTKLQSGNIPIVPGKSADSEMIRRITSTEETVRMPPKGDPLTPQQVAKLRAWIDQGAKY